MLSAERRIELLIDLGKYIQSGDDEWMMAKDRTIQANAWFTEGHIDMAVNNIATCFLQEGLLRNWLRDYNLPVTTPQTVGIVMAGNIPLVGFHDFLCGFISGHKLMIKLSSKDNVLLTTVVNKLIEWEPLVAEQMVISELLKGCDAYIATGSNNSARYFEEYFKKYPHIIRRNRTSVAILDGTETDEELRLLADDVFSYFGLGCRNVTQLYLPENYDLGKIFNSFSIYSDVINHNKYKNNFDYFLAIYMLNRVPYHTDNKLLMVENEVPFSAVSVLHYRYYTDKPALEKELANNIDIQCIVGHGHLPFGNTQSPTLTDYADGVNTMEFLERINE